MTVASCGCSEAQDTGVKGFDAQGGAVLIVSVSHSVINQVYTGNLYDKFQKEEINTHYLNAPANEQIKILKTYIMGKSPLLGVGKGFLFVTFGLFFSFWISGVLTLPLKKLVSAIERVADGELDVKVPVQTNDEYW